jgi:hypothetical protein
MIIAEWKPLPELVELLKKDIPDEKWLLYLSMFRMGFFFVGNGRNHSHDDPRHKGDGDQNQAKRNPNSHWLPGLCRLDHS